MSNININKEKLKNLKTTSFSNLTSNWSLSSTFHRELNAMDEAFYLANILPKFISSFDIYKNDLHIIIDKEKVEPVLNFLKTHLVFRYRTLFDICCIDFLKRHPYRFQLVYGLLSIKNSKRIFVKTNVKEKNSIMSMTSLFNSANWLEREVWDTFGVFFRKHPDLRRILTDYGFEGHPLRKDFPLSGYLEIRYDDSKKRVI